jgi:hypothetical protein
LVRRLAFAQRNQGNFVQLVPLFVGGKEGSLFALSDAKSSFNGVVKVFQGSIFRKLDVPEEVVLGV